MEKEKKETYETMNSEVATYLVPAALSDETNVTSYSVNECYQLHSYEKKNVEDDANYQHRMFEAKVSESEQGSCKRMMKGCLLAFTFLAVLTALATIAALVLAVINYSHLTGELTDKVNLLSSELNQVRNGNELTNELNMLRSQLNLVTNETQGLEKEVTNEVNLLRSKLNQVMNITREIDSELTNEANFLRNQLIQMRNETQETERELTSEVNFLRGQLNQVINVTQEIESKLANDVNLSIQPNCGAGLWNRVAFLNMSDPSQQCPSSWRLVTTGGVRACGRLNSLVSSCHSKLYCSAVEYQRVCGRVIGYQFSHPDGFGFRPLDLNINNDTRPYVDGVSITYGQPRNHIWTYAAGLSENSTYLTAANCPCSPLSGQRPPQYVGNNYYCESGNPNTNENSFLLGLYTADKIWDGQQCEGTCCSGSICPPWFSVSLANPKTESIEVRICGDQPTVDEDTPIELLEIYVQ